MRITFLNQKGGVGKTTLVLMLASVMRRAKFAVSIDDRDPQGSARFFAPNLGLPLYDPDSPTPYVITDTPGHLRIDGEAGAELRKLVASSDRLVLVTEKSPASVHGSGPMARLIAAEKRDDAAAYVLFNKVRAGTNVGEQRGADIAAELGLPALSVELPLSSAFENAFVGGMASVTGKRRDDLMSLALEVLK